jgi:hypothetical protein
MWQVILMTPTYLWKSIHRFCVPGVLFSIVNVIILTFVAAEAQLPATTSQQDGGYSAESLFIALFSNGDALVEYDINITDPMAEEIRVPLFAESSVRNLIVVDYEDNVVEYAIGSTPNEIVLRAPGVSNVRISYTTQDLVDKSQMRWIFTLNSPDTGFSVRLPPESVLVDFEPQPSITPFAGQYLLTFDDPGPARIMYVIGVLGTEEQANIVIRLADTTINQVRTAHPDIVLAGAEGMLQQATAARDADRFGDAETLATRANDAALAAGRDFVAAQQAISGAGAQIEAAAGENRDTSSARQLLQQANAEFENGNYVAARNAAEDAVDAMGEMPPAPELPVSVIVAATVAGAGAVGTLVFLRMRRSSKSAPALSQQKRAAEPRDPPASSSSSNNSSNSNISRSAFRPPVAEIKAREPEEELETVEEDSNNSSSNISSLPIQQEPATIPDSQTDTSMLLRIVGRMLEERPHLRPEDQEVLRYLAEKEGAAFESELRSKFQLPKTTIWRLVKRLEREELVEIRKAGGQNLIKLKFEDRQA